MDQQEPPNTWQYLHVGWHRVHMLFGRQLGYAPSGHVFWYPPNPTVGGTADDSSRNKETTNAAVQPIGAEGNGRSMEMCGRGRGRGTANGRQMTTYGTRRLVVAMTYRSPQLQIQRQKGM